MAHKPNQLATGACLKITEPELGRGGKLVRYIQPIQPVWRTTQVNLAQHWRTNQVNLARHWPATKSLFAGLIAACGTCNRGVAVTVFSGT